MSEKKEEQKTQVGIQVQLDEETAQGQYSNLAMLNHNETEFVFDFIYVQPQQPKAKVRSRIICSPQNAKRFLMAMGENIKRYEDKFGTIAAAKSPPKPIVH
jgi:hypothetical protein